MKLFGYEIIITKTNPVDAVPINTTIHVQPDKPWPRKTTFAVVQMLIHRNCGNPLDEIKPESTPDDLMLDSLDEVELMMAVEEEFDIDIQMTDWEDCRNVDEVVKLVNKILMEK